MKKIIILIISSAVISGCSGGLSKSWRKPGVEYNEFSQAIETCISASKTAKKNVSSGYNDGTAAGGFGAGVARGIKKARVGLSAEQECFTSLGYTQFDLSEQEQSQFKKAGNKEAKIKYLYELNNK